MSIFIHTIHSLSIRQYGIIDSTENISLLKRWYNPFPVGWFDTEIFFIAFREMLGQNTKNTSRHEAYKLLSYNRIIMLDRMLNTMSVLMRNQNDRSMFRLLFQRKQKDYTGNLNYYIEKVKQITGIKVKDGKDLTKLQKEIQRRLDKYNERYSHEEKTPKEKADFMDIVLGVFSIMEMAYVSEMRLAEFGRLKMLADKRIKAIEKSKNA